jgi:hypothetical protein
MGADMTATNMGTGTKVTSVTTSDLARPVRHGGARLLVAWSLLLTPYIAAHAADDQSHESAIATQILMQVIAVLDARSRLSEKQFVPFWTTRLQLIESLHQHIDREATDLQVPGEME